MPDLLLQQVLHSQPAALLIQQGPVRTNFNGGVVMKHQRPAVPGLPSSFHKSGSLTLSVPAVSLSPWVVFAKDHRYMFRVVVGWVLAR